MSVAEKVDGEPLTLGEARQAVSDARAAAAGLRARAASGERVRGAALAAADADIELADLALQAVEAEAVAEAERSRMAELEATVTALLESEAAAAGEFLAARAARRAAESVERHVLQRHAGLVGELQRLAAGFPMMGGPVWGGGGPPKVREVGGGYRAVLSLSDPGRMVELEARFGGGQ